jgi:uncharacterized repeat protein (TIGR02543 family)
MGSLCVTVNNAAAGFTLNTTNGIIDPYWVSTPDGQRWDKTVVGLSPGYYRITFNPVEGESTPPEQIFQITTNNIAVVEGVYGSNAVNTPVVVLTSPLDQQALWGASLSASAFVAAGTPPYTVTVYTKPVGGAYSPAGVATTDPYTVSLSALSIGTYQIYATVTDSSMPVSLTATSATNTFIVAPTITWTNSAATGNWSDPLSWDSGAVPVSGATVVFATGGDASVLDTTSRTVSSVLFNREAAFTLNNSGGAGLTINSNITASNKFTNTINVPVTLGAANIWTVNDGSTLQVNGAVGGSVGLTKAGIGTLALASDNSFTGGVTLKAGTLLLGGGNSLGTGTLTIDGGYINQPTGHLTMPRNNPVVLNGTFTWTGNNGYSWNMGSGAVTLNKPISIYVGNNLTIGGVVSGPGGLNALDIAFKNMVGAGYGVELLAPITLRADQTITGAGEVISGVIGDAGHGYALTVSVPDVWATYGGVVTLNAANTYSGATTVSIGSLAIGHDLALQYSALNTAAGIAILSATSPTIGGLNGSTDLALVFKEGYSSVRALTLNPQSGTCTYSGAIANGFSGMTLIKNGNGTQTLSGSNTYTGATNVNAGTLILDGANTGGGAVTVKSGARLGGNGSIASAVTVQSGGKLLANISDWDAGICSNLTVSTLSLPSTWSINVSASSFTETDKTFSFLTATGSISGFTTQAVTGPGAGTWLVRQNSSDVRILELVYSAVHGTPTTLDLVSLLNPADVGESVTFTATVKDGGAAATGATGTCVFKVDGTVMATLPMVNGTANYSHSFTFGPHAIVATYSGDAAYATSSASLTQICGNMIVPTYTTRSDGKTVATFTSGTGLWMVPSGVSSVEVLVVGGGGGAWNVGYSTGSGAGGMYYSASYAVTSGSSVGITVGAGATNSTGSSSLFGTQLIAYGGAPGNGTYYDAGDQGAYSLNGGSTVVPGNVGGDYPAPMDGNWTSGGGAGHIGYKGDAQLGGAGAACPITGSVVYYAGGGGAPSSYASSGGTGHNLGGGGSGPTVWNVDHAFSGLANTGGGGGGGWGGGGGAGGSGVVIVAYESSVVTTYTVVFNSNGGSSVASQSVAPGGTATQPDPVPIKTGSTFSGWYSNSELTNIFDFATVITANTTLYAKWVPDWVVTFANNGGSSVVTQYVAPGGTATQPDPAPTKTGSTFAGWYSNSELTNIFNFATVITADTTLYAKWTINSYTLTYSADLNGTVEGTTPQTITYGGNGTAVTAKPNSGYQFVKWSDNSTSNPRTDSNVTFNISVTASFELISTDTISPTTSVTRGDGKTVATFSAVGSGTWTIPSHTGDLEVLVVGGGGSGLYNGGGGGGGGFFHRNAYTVASGHGVTVTVGAGGTGGASGGSPGSSSVFDSLTAYGGAGGGASIGGASGGNNQGGAGCAGGTNSGGGGGAGQIGANDWNNCAKGGDGLSSTIADGVTAVSYAGGGSCRYNGADGGLGGGGSTTDNNPAAINVPNGVNGLGGGGAGGRNSAADAGAGGSGVVIVVYQVSAPSTPYDTWTNRYSGSDLTNPGADLDGDGLTNQQEFAFGLDPTKGTSANPITASLGKESHQFSYTRYAASELGYTVWTSTDLKSWAGPAAATQTVVSTSGGVETVEVTLLSPPSGDKLFVRAQAE